MIIVLGSALVAEGMEAEALELSLGHVRRSRLEDGCISHDVSVDTENASKLVFVERWRDMPALLSHFSLDASKGFVADLTRVLSETPVMKVYNAEDVSVKA